MLIKIKKTGNKTYSLDGKLYFIAALVVFVLTFIFLIIATRQFISSILFSLILSVGVTFVVYLFDQVGKKRHQTNISSKLFKNLIEKGFEIEQVNEYCGLIGTYNDTAIRIYYDWNKITKGFMVFGDIVICTYYEPLVLPSDPEIADEEKMNILNDSIKPSFWTKEKVFTKFYPQGLIRQLNYTPFTSITTIISELDKVTNLIKENNLTPIDKTKLLEYQKRPNYNYAPPIETYIVVEE